MTPDMSYEREGDWHSNAQKIRVDGSEKEASINYCISCTFGVCIDWLGAV